MGEMLMPVKMSWQRLRQMILHREGRGGRGRGKTDGRGASRFRLQVVPSSGCQASSSRGSGKKSGNKRSPRLISLGSSASSIEDDLESDGEMNK